MATACRKAPLPVEPDIVLTLSLGEASVLAQVLRHVGGLSSGPRGRVDDITEALKAAGVSPSTMVPHGSIYF